MYVFMYVCYVFSSLNLLIGLNYWHEIRYSNKC
jgi:hypothetical protein